MDLFDKLVIPHEGLRLMPYKDTMGLLTIGRGRCLDRQGISLDEADYLYQNDKKKVVLEVLKALPWVTGLDAARLAVLQSMAFQLGIGGLLKFKATLGAVKAGNFFSASDYMLDSLWAKQTPARVKMLAQVMKTGVIP